VHVSMCVCEREHVCVCSHMHTHRQPAPYTPPQKQTQLFADDEHSACVRITLDDEVKGEGHARGAGGGIGDRGPRELVIDCLHPEMARRWVVDLRYVLVSKETYNRPKETYLYGKRGLSAIAYLRYAYA